MSESYPGEVGSSIASSASSTHPMLIMSFMLKSVLGLLLFVTAVLPYFLDEQTNPAMLALLVSGLVLVLYHKTLVEEQLLLARAGSSYGDERRPSSALRASVALFAITLVLQIMSMTVHQRQQCQAGALGASESSSSSSEFSTSRDEVESLAARYTEMSALNCVALFVALLLVVRFDTSYTVG